MPESRDETPIVIDERMVQKGRGYLKNNPSVYFIEA